MLRTLFARPKGRSVLAVAIAVCMPALTLAAPARAETAEITIEIKDHKFLPAEVKVPSGTRIELTVKNSDSSAEEFESFELGVEKVIAGNASAIIRLKPLKKGSYDFFGEYHVETAQGKIIAE
jgi:plastocyanin